jgi:TIR domain
MADIFVSYSNQDRDLALKLSAFLEAKGWSVWWDRHLTAGDEFRDEIMKQLGLARAVIVIWSKNSVGSNWIRSEAGRGQAAQKLIPVKVVGINYKDIPPPFDVLHTEDIDNEELIHGAVVAQLAKPIVEPPLLKQLSASVRYHALNLAGAIGGGISLFVYTEKGLELANWAQFLVREWQSLTTAVWSWLFAWINIVPPKEVMPLLTLSAFLFVGTLGAVLRSRQVSSFFEADTEVNFFIRNLALAAVVIIVLIFGGFNLDEYRRLLAETTGVRVLLYVAPRSLIYGLATGLIVFGPSAVLLLFLHGRREDPFEFEQFDQFFRPLTARLPYFLALLLCLVFLNEVSKLGLEQYLKAPRILT